MKDAPAPAPAPASAPGAVPPRASASAVRLVHVSDLHFGRDIPELLEPLIAAANAAAPDLLVVSGDLTQRARESQFAAARGFLDRIDAPRLCVPGNHDIPLENWARRLTRPFRGYRKAMGRELEPETTLEGGVRVIGLNTVSPFLWQRGWFTRGAVRRTCARLAEGGPGRINVLVAHHPFHHGESARKDLMRGAGRAIDALSACGADVVLCGHLHAWSADAFVLRDGRAGALQVQVGTSVSSRARGEPNDFAILDFDGPSLRLTRMAFSDRAFRPIGETAWLRGPAGGWQARGAAGSAGAAPGDKVFSPSGA